MGTLLKYLFYALVILAIYFIAVGFYRGKLTGDSTVSEVAEHVTSQTGDTIKDGYDTTKEAIQNTLSSAESKAQKDVREIKIETNEIVRDVQ